jgi:cytochrome P450
MSADLVGIDFWAQPPTQRHTEFARLRALDGPVFFPEPKIPLVRAGKGFYALVRHADVVEVSRNAKVFSSEPAATSPEPPPWIAWLFGRPMVNMDDPRHGRLRRIVSRAFSPKMLSKIQDEIQATATQIVDDVERDGAHDFVDQVAARLPIHVICALMGIPPEQRPYVLKRIDVMTEYSGVRGSLFSPRTIRLLLGNLKAIVDLHRLVKKMGHERRGNPQDDLVSALVNANPDGEALTDRELGSFFDLLLVAGNETTRNALAHGVKLFTDNPDQRDLLLNDYETHIGGAIEEIVRYVSPIIQFRRTLLEPYKLNGHQFSAGDKVVMFYLAANRDPAVFKDPDVFDITRSPNPHVGFGGPGPHLCLGANLARMELKIMFRELYTRHPTLRTTAEPELLLSNFDNGVLHQPFAL